MGSASAPVGGRSFYMPHETGPQVGAMMSWPTECSVVHETGTYPPGDINATRLEVAAIARAIAKYQPLHLFVRDPAIGEGRLDVKDTNLETAKAILGDVKGITIHPTQNVYSLWARDTGPTFVRSKSGTIKNDWSEGDDPGVGFQGRSTQGETVAMLLNYNQWGRKCVPNPDMYLAATAAEAFNVPAVLAPFISEGGAIEVDGDGTLLVAESCILNPNRNPGLEKAAVEQYFVEAFGIEKTIWIPGERGRDITDDHIDALARFARPGVVLVSKPFVPEGSKNEKVLKNYHDIKEILSRTTDARGRTIQTIDVPEPDPAFVLGKDYFPMVGPSVAYVNYLVVNGAVIVSAFGDEKADTEAKRIIGEQFPGRVVEQVGIHHLGCQGGGIHCATQQILG